MMLVDAAPPDLVDAMTDAAATEMDASLPIGAETWRTIVRDPNEALPRRLDAAFFGIEQDTCFLNEGDTSGCDFTTFTIDSSHVEPVFEQREAVLVVDIIAPSVEMLRYRDRVLGFYEVTSDGTIAATSLEWELPEVFGQIVTGFATSPAIPSEEFSELLTRLQEVYSESVPPFSTHGLTVFNILADLIPKNPIVFLNNNLLTFHQSIPDIVCAVERSGNEIDVQALREQSERFAEDLRALFETHHIRFVNASWGYTIESIRGPWMSVCGTEAPDDEILLAILEAYRPVFDALFNTEGVFTAHAALASPIDEHYPFDQDSPEFPNRLRVGAFQHNGAEVPAEGLTEVASDWLPAPEESDEADVWVNSGCAFFFDCRAERPLSFSVQYGMGRVDFPVAQSSFTNPVLLGMFIYIRNQMAIEAMDNSLITDIIAMLIPECETEPAALCRYIDPLLHQQLDRYD